MTVRTSAAYDVSSLLSLLRRADDQTGRAIARPAANTASRKTIEPRSMISIASEAILPCPNSRPVWVT